MTGKDRWMLIMVALAGVGVCVTALVGFLTTIMSNGLPWDPGQSVRDYYLAVGQSYSQGFSVGFFLCFFLSMVAVAVGTWKGRAPITRPVTAPSRVPDPSHVTR